MRYDDNQSIEELKTIKSKLYDLFNAEYARGVKDATDRILQATQPEPTVHTVTNKTAERLGKLSLYPLSLEDALGAALQTGPLPRHKAHE